VITTSVLLPSALLLASRGSHTCSTAQGQMSEPSGHTMSAREMFVYLTAWLGLLPGQLLGRVVAPDGGATWVV
jgi:hypothetical protein